jgi:foldase protein PrsA
MSRLRVLLFLALLPVLAVSVTACGSDDSVPGNAVARVGDSNITRTDYDHWVDVASISQAQQTDPSSTAKPSVPVPPNFTACVAKAKAALPKKLPKGQKNPTDAQLKAQCKQQYEALRDQVMQFLISSAWIQGAAKDEGVSVTDKQVTAELNKQKKQSYPKEADFQKFLKSSGMTMDDLLFRVKVDLLSQKIRDKVTKGAATVTPAAIKAYYNKNKTKFGTPESRDVKIVLTKTEAQANAAKKALEAGQSWKAVAKKYSIDQATKANGGELAGVTKGQQEASLDKAIFGAEKGKIVGPVKTQFGYYVVQVEKVTPGIQQTLQQATPTIKQQLEQEGQQKKLDTFVKDFQKTWTDKTNCQKGYIVQSCKNAPKPKTTTAGSTTPANVQTTQ